MTKDVVLNMRVKPDVLSQIDFAADRLGKTRSAFIREAAAMRALEIVNSYPPTDRARAGSEK